ncbi:hypothetical protein [Escherichia phage BUCT-XGG-1]
MAIRRQATAGMIADTSLYNIDGACAMSSSLVRQVGTAVGVSSVVDGHKVLAAPSAESVYGVLVKSHYESPKGTYGGAAGDIDNYQVANVMTHGRIWVQTSLDAAPAFGSAITVNASGIASSTVAGAADFALGTAAGGFQAADAVSGEPALVEVQLLQK